MSARQITEFITQPLAAALTVSILTLAIGVLAKWLASQRRFEARDTYLGIPMTIAALAAALVAMLDVGRELVAPPNSPAKKLAQLRFEDLRTLPADQFVELQRAQASEAGVTMVTGTFAFIVALAILFFVMVLHRNWDQRTGLRQKFWLGIVANLVGFVLLAVTLALVKGAF